ncbi:MAG: hypothetical protein GY940_24595 [bacterium]|nr:hypothetical protein [bacterium]
MPDILVSVSVSLNIFGSLTYRYTGDPDHLNVGQRVVVPLMNRLTTGWVMEKGVQYKGRVKGVMGVIDDGYIPDESFMAFAEAVSGVYFASAGSVLDSSLSPKRKSMTTLCFETSEGIKKLKDHSFKEIQQLSKEGVLTFFYKSSRKHEEGPGETGPAVGVEPGNGGLEPGAALPNRCLLSYSRLDDYKPLIGDTLDRGESVLIAVPDNFTAGYLRETLGDAGMDLDIYTSQLKLSEREALWQSYGVEGKVGVITGGLSAVYLPIRNLGLIIVERAGSPFYKRTAFSRFNINTLARLRAKVQGVSLVEGGPSYTVGAYNNSSGLFAGVEDKRKDRVKATVHMIPARTQGIPDAMMELANSYFMEGKRLLVVVNRKASVDILFCPKCKKQSRCPACEGFLEVDESFNISCKRCGLKKESYKLCPKCSEPLVVVENISVASIKKAIQKRMVETGVITLFADDLKENGLKEIKERVRESKVIISTPVVVNPFFNGLLDAVIYIRPETFVNLDEYDSAERVFALVSELKETVSHGGTIDIFSTFHFHYALKLVNEEDAFFEREMKYREWFRLPPFCNVYHIEVRSKKLRSLAKEIRTIKQKFQQELGIKKIYLTSRKAMRGNFKGILEAHAQPDDIIGSGLLERRDVNIQLELV